MAVVGPGAPSARSSRPAPPWRVRRAAFEDAACLLRLIERAVERGCASHYNPVQRRAVFLSYARSLCLDLLGPAETLVAEVEGRIVGVGQLLPGMHRLSALFVDADAQGQAHGRRLLDEVLARARALALPRIEGAMSLNAVAFYARNGFRPCAGSHRLLHSGVVIPVLPMEKVLAPI